MNYQEQCERAARVINKQGAQFRGETKDAYPKHPPELQKIIDKIMNGPQSYNYKDNEASKAIIKYYKENPRK